MAEPPKDKRMSQTVITQVASKPRHEDGQSQAGGEVRKVVINACHGGFGLSEAGILRYAAIRGITPYPEPGRFKWDTTWWTLPPEGRPAEILADEEWRAASLEARIASNKAYSASTLCPREIARDDAALVQAVEELGENANGDHAQLKVVEIPAGVEWEIDEYDGLEWVAEKHRRWS